MLEALQKPILSVLKVPPEPDPPRGDPASVRVFRAARGYFRYRLLAWGWKQLVAVVGLLSGIAFLRFFAGRAEELPQIFRLLPFFWLELFEYLAIAGFLIQLPISLLLVALDFHYRWYIVTDRSLRIREGVRKVQERTMTFSNIQNVSIRQGPVQRVFGIADLEVRTAGGGGKESEGEQGEGEDNLHIGYFRGVANAGEIRDAVLADLRRLRVSGLGDPDEPVAATSRPAEPDRLATEAAREVLREARGLRAALR